MPNSEPRARSTSLNVDDSDPESLAADTAANTPGKPGRKKNPNSQTARRDQNRIAQREFRLRKQQRIRDLEARVEILSGGKDEALSEMRSILKDLMAENHTLRGLLRSLGAFIGEGVGGLLPKLGWDVSDFNNLIDRSETDTAWESYQRRKKTRPQQESPPTPVTAPSGQKRRSDDDVSNTTKKARVNMDGESERTQNGFSLVMPMNPPLATNNMYTPTQDSNEIFPGLMRSSAGSPMFMQASSPNTTSPPYGTSASNLNNYQTSYVPGVNINIEPSLPAMSFNPPTAGAPTVQRVQATSQLPPDHIEEEDDQNKSEAYKLITYHLDNFKRNAGYCLPASLRPTLVQRTVPHESVIDRILHPELRDRMILLRGRYDLVDCLFDYRNAVTIHGDDVLAHSNWEISEKWLRQYGYLVDQATLNICNRWRRERGEPELRLVDITPPEQSPGAS